MSDTAGEATAEAPALPGDGLREGVVERLRADLGEQLIDVHLEPQHDLWVRVAPEAWFAAGNSLKAQGFTYFCFLSAIDWLPSPYGKGENEPEPEGAADTGDGAEEPAQEGVQGGPEQPPAGDQPTQIVHGVTGGEQRFQVLARLTDVRRHVGITLKADVPDSMSIASWVPLFAGANWHERETHEMFGIGFEGHNDLRNLYLPGEFEGYPLRKDFPLLSRMVKPWPGIVDVEQMPGLAEEEAPAQGGGA